MLVPAREASTSHFQLGQIGELMLFGRYSHRDMRRWRSNLVAEASWIWAVCLTNESKSVEVRGSGLFCGLRPVTVEGVFTKRCSKGGH